MQPTYRFKSGIPGSSYALEICQRLGISDDILKRARHLLGEEKQKLEELILALDRKTQDSDKLQQELEMERTRLQGLTRVYQERIAGLKQYEKETKQKALQESEALLAQSNALIENTIKEIKESQAERQVVAKGKKQLQEWRHQVTAARDTSSASEAGGHREPAQIAEGETVFWAKQKKTGQIVATQEGSDKVLVQFDSVKFWVPTAELEQAGRTAKSRPEVSIHVQAESKDSVLPEIDVRGQNIAEATRKVDKFLDDALLAGWEQVRIIHGKGTGALRKGIIAFLETHARVKASSMAAWNEGDFGVTVVELH